MKLESRKKFQIPIISIVLLSLVFNFLAAPLVLAAEAPVQTQSKTADEKIIEKARVGFGAGSALLWGLNIILTAALLAVSKFVSLAGTFFDLTIRNAALSGFSNLVAIKEGWRVSRDVANLFFILILLAIAIATILRVTNYNAKALLPKLIVIALLINFSLTIGYVVIDSANILGLQFWNVLTKNGSISISQSLMAGARFQQIFDTSDIDQGSYVRSGALWGNIGGLLAGGIVAVGCATGIFCPGAIGLATAILGGAAVGVSWAKLSNATDIKTAIDYFYLVMVPLVVSLPLVFVFMFGGILMIIRFAILTLLLALAPLAFLFYILPTTEKYWREWWEKLIMHSFFFPAFMFLLYISISIANAMARSAVGGNITQNFAFLVDTTTVVVLLISSLLIARTMGIYFAGSVLNWATASRKWLTGATGALAARYTTGIVGAAITPAAAKLQERFPILGTAPMRFTGWLRGLGGAEQRAQAMADFAKRLTPEKRAEYFEKLNTQEKAALLGKMSESEQNDMMPFLSGANQGLVRRMVGGQMGAAAAAKFDIERWRRQTLLDQQAQMAGWITPGNRNYNPEAATEAMRAMNDDEKAKMVDSLELMDPALAANADNFIKSHLSPKDYQNFKIARILRKPEPQQQTEWASPDFTDEDKEMFLHKKDAKGQARFIGGLPAAQKAAAENIIQTRFSGGEQNAYKEAVVENIASKSVDIIETAAATMTDQELGTLVKVGDESKVAALINKKHAKAATLGSIIKERGLENKYINLITPESYATIKGKVRGAADYGDALKEYFTKVDTKALRRNLTPNIVEQKEFVEDVLAGATMEDISLMTGDRRRAEAFLKGLENIISGFGGMSIDTKAQKLADEMKAKSNAVALKELQEYINKASPYQDVITSILEGKPPPQQKAP